jgi:hypothetical protein
MAMIAITTSSSISVKPPTGRRGCARMDFMMQGIPGQAGADVCRGTMPERMGDFQSRSWNRMGARACAIPCRIWDMWMQMRSGEGRAGDRACVQSDVAYATCGCKCRRVAITNEGRQGRTARRSFAPPRGASGDCPISEEEWGGDVLIAFGEGPRRATRTLPPRCRLDLGAIRGRAPNPTTDSLPLTAPTRYRHDPFQ